MYIVIPVPSAERKEKAHKSKNQQKLKSIILLPGAPDGKPRQSRFLPDHGENHSAMVHSKHPIRAQILDSKIPKSMEKPPKLGEYHWKGDVDENA